MGVEEVGIQDISLLMIQLPNNQQLNVHFLATQLLLRLFNICSARSTSAIPLNASLVVINIKKCYDTVLPH